jgi:hypothetical protein
MRLQIRPISKGEDTMSHAVKMRRARAFLGRAAVAVPAAWLMFQVSTGNVILKAAGINPNEQKWGEITKVANQLQAPLLVTMVAAVPLGIIGGGVLMAIGHRHAAKILGQVIAGVVVVGIGTALAE